MPYRLIYPLTRLYISIKPAEPLNLSLTPLEKKIIKEFKEHNPVHEISQNFQLNIANIYKIINLTRIVKIKIGGRYTPDIKKRIQEARDLGITVEKIAEIFNLEKYKVIYIDRCNRSTLIKQLSPFITFAPRRSHHQVIHRLKMHCMNRHCTTQALRKT